MDSKKMTKVLICRFFSIIMFANYLICICLFNVIAFNSAPFFVCDLSIDDVPKGSCYLDLLVQQKELPPKWYKKQAKYPNCYSVSIDAPIAAYKEGGYVSYMLHCQDSVCRNNEICKEDNKKIIQVSFGEDDNMQHTKEMSRFLRRLKRIRFAYIDSDGNILSVTESVRPNNANPFLYRETIRIQGENVQVKFVSGPPYWVQPIVSLVCVGIIICWIVSTRQKHAKRTSVY